MTVGKMMAFPHPCVITSGVHAINVTLKQLEDGPVVLYVVPSLIRQATTAGALSVDEDANPIKAAPVAEPAAEDPSLLSKHETLVSVLGTIVEENNPEDFGGNGVPRIQAVSDRIGERITRDELTRAWRELRREGERVSAE